MTKQQLLATRNNAEQALEQGGLTADTRIALMNVSRRAQKELDRIGAATRLPVSHNGKWASENGMNWGD